MYDTEKLKDIASCIEIANLLGIPKASNGRYIAVWRGGSNGNVQIEPKHWWDFKEEKGGDVIDLVATMRNTHFIEAARFVAKHYGVAPDKPARMPQGNTRYDMLLADGYKETARYEYQDADGKAVHYAVRMEHPEKKKEFLQCDAAGRWSVKNVQLCLYNLPAIKASKWVCVVEGEKDADTLIRWGIPATTNAGGSKKWEDRYSDVLIGKDVVLMPDNDDAGRIHMDMVGKSIAGKARSIRILCVSKLEKGDVTDWAQKEGGNKPKLLELVKNAPKWAAPDDIQVELAMAKEANTKPFANFVSHFEQAPNQKKPTIEKNARPLNEMVEDAHMRLLGFPRKIGESLMFDHDRDTKQITYIDSTQTLWAWMHAKLKKPMPWTRGDSMVTKGEFYEGLRMAARKYESISLVPDYPRRDDVYYAHPPLPEPTVGHTAFEGLIDFFKPENAYYRILLKSLFCAPMFFRKGIPRPMWIIDSHEGAGVGKTTVAESISTLYGSSPIRVTKQDLEFSDKLTKRMMSSEGRNAKVLLLDNITGKFKSEYLSGLITAPTITGMAPYGKGEEVRMNNLTYIMTANSASVDNDISIRSFYIYLSRPNMSDKWEDTLMAYIEQNRMAIFADIIDILSNGPVFNVPSGSRFPVFETQIMHKVCQNESEIKSCIALLREAREESNNEEELAIQIDEIFRDRIEQLHPTADHHQFFVPTKTVWMWLKDGLDGFAKDDSEAIQKVRDLAKNRILDSIQPKPDRYPHHSTPEVRKKKGVMWRGAKYDDGCSKTYCLVYKDGANQYLEV